MRIVHWYQNFLGGGGVTNAVLGLSDAQFQLGHKVLITAMKTEGPSLYEPLAGLVQSEVLTWQPRMRLRWSALDLAVPDGKLFKQLDKWQPDIVHIHGEYLPSNIWAGRAASCPVVLTPHGAFHPHRFDSGSGMHLFRQNLYVRFARALLYKRLDAVHALSPIEEHQIRRMMPDLNVFSIPQGPSAQMEPLLTSTGREDIEETSGPPKLLFVGRLDVHTKGLDILLPAFEQALRKLPSDGISLRLVGPDWKGGLSVLQKITAQLGITSKVEFMGAKDSPSVAKLLRETDIFVLLSRNEGFSLSLAEALIAGKPSIVSTEVGILSYQEVASLRYIYPVKPDVEQAAEAITFCVRNIRALRSSAAEFGPKAKEFFDWPRIAKLHIERYRELQEGNGTSKPGGPMFVGCESR